jgi:DNA repair exonuclease SbcCD nuclease subunit
MFRYAPDVIKSSEIPEGFSAVLAGHIHRFQVLTKDLQAKGLHAPVFYAGSIERTSFAERNEKKGYLILEFELEALKGGILRQWQFHKLPVRPMIQLNLHASNMKNAELRSWIETRLTGLPEDSIVKVKIHDTVSQQAMEVLSAAALRTLAPTTMNINAVFVEAQRLQTSKMRG